MSSTSFEFDYFISIVKYVLFYFLNLGILPFLFEKMNLNRNQKRKLIRDFSMISDDSQIYNEIKMKKFKKSEENIFKSTNIVGDVDPKSQNNLEFLIRTNTYDDRNENIIHEKDEEYNI